MLCLIDPMTIQQADTLHKGQIQGTTLTGNDDFQLIAHSVTLIILTLTL